MPQGITPNPVKCRSHKQHLTPHPGQKPQDASLMIGLEYRIKEHQFQQTIYQLSKKM